MDMGSRLPTLQALYRIFDAFINSQPVACRQGCASCCTCNVALTTLEGLQMVRYLEVGGDPGWGGGLRRCAAGRRYRPQVTVNGMAALCAAGQPLPEEENDPDWGRCPFLSGSACSVYEARPFACRCMVSHVACRQGGQATVDPLIVSVGNVFMQVIEHLDVPGCSGNLADVVRVLADGDNRKRYRTGGMDCSRHGLIANRPMEVLMIPPEHRVRLQPLLDAIRAVPMPAA